MNSVREIVKCAYSVPPMPKAGIIRRLAAGAKSWMAGHPKTSVAGKAALGLGVSYGGVKLVQKMMNRAPEAVASLAEHAAPAAAKAQQFGEPMLDRIKRVASENPVATAAGIGVGAGYLLSN